MKHVALTQDAADLFRRVPDETGGLKDPQVSRRPCLGRSAPEGNLDYLDALVADGRVGGIFRQARQIARSG